MIKSQTIIQYLSFLNASFLVPKCVDDARRCQPSWNVSLHLLIIPILRIFFFLNSIYVMCCLPFDLRYLGASTNSSSASFFC